MVDFFGSDLFYLLCHFHLTLHISDLFTRVESESSCLWLIVTDLHLHRHKPVIKDLNLIFLSLANFISLNQLLLDLLIFLFQILLKAFKLLYMTQSLFKFRMRMKPLLLTVEKLKFKIMSLILLLSQLSSDRPQVLRFLALQVLSLFEINAMLLDIEFKFVILFLKISNLPCKLINKLWVLLYLVIQILFPLPNLRVQPFILLLNGTNQIILALKLYPLNLNLILQRLDQLISVVHESINLLQRGVNTPSTLIADSARPHHFSWCQPQLIVMLSTYHVRLIRCRRECHLYLW